jgi:hypothetical protein
MFDDEAGNWCEARVGFEPVPKIGAVPHFEKQLIERPFAQPMGLPGVSRDNLDETGATIMMRRGGRMG